MKRKLRRWAYAAAGLALLIAVMVFYAPRDRSDGAGGDADAVAADADVVRDALKQFNTEQEQLRSMQIMQLDEIINSEKSSQELVDQAQAEKLAIVERMETEQLIAGILRARGYTDAAAASGDGYITIMVRADQAGVSDIARISELVLAQTDIMLENIKIIPIN